MMRPISRSWTVITGFGFVLALVSLILLRLFPGYTWFELGAPVLAFHNATTPIFEVAPLRKDAFYVVSVLSDTAAPFQLFFTYPDHQTSKALVFGQTRSDSARPLQSVIQARHENASAAITIVPRPGSGVAAITFRLLQVSQLNPRYYVWRNLIRAVSCLVLLLTGLQLIWRLYCRLAEKEWSVPQFGRLRPAVWWAVCLLVLGAGFDATFLKQRHQGLFETPFHSSVSGWDSSFYYFWLRSAMVDGDLDFADDLLYCDTLSLPHRQEIVRNAPRTATGLIPNKYPIGLALLCLPWYAAGSLSAHVANLFGKGVLYDGWGPVYQFFLVCGQAVYAIAGLYYAYRILLEYFSPALAVCAAMFGWLGSPLFFYQTLDVFMSHNVMFFAMTGAYYYSYRLMERPERLILWFLVGLLSAFVILARYQGAIMLIFPAAICIRELVRDLRRWSGFMIACLAGAGPIALQVIAWKVVFGSFFLYTYQGETFSWRHPHLFEVLFSPFHGLFNWHPMMLVGFGGFLAWVAIARRDIATGCFACSLALAIYINAAWDCWWFGASFGSRAFETCTLFSMFGIAYLLTAMLRRLFVFHAISFALLLLVLWNMNMMWLSAHGRLPLEHPVTWRERLEISKKYWSS